MAIDKFGNQIVQKSTPDGSYGGLDIVNTTRDATYSRLNPGTKIGDTPTNPLLTGDTKTKSPLDTAKEKLQNQLAQDVVAPSEDAVREQARMRAQAIIDQINLSFVPQYQDQAKAAKIRDRRTQALSISSGAAGSDFATAKAEETSTANAKDKSLLDQQKQSKIQQVLLDLDQRATDEYKTKREEYLKTIEGNFSKIQEFQKAQSESARNNAIQLASQGIDINALKENSPDVYKQLVEESGYAPTVFNAFYNSQLPQNKQRQYEYKTVGDKIYAISVNPVTKKIETEELDTPAGFDQFMVTPDGTPLFINKSKGTAQVAGGFSEGQFARATTPKSTTPSTVTKDLEDAYAVIAQGANVDDVRREFLKDYPKSAALFNSYVKKTKESGRTK